MKHIISCSDGTWNKPGASESGKNVRVTDNGKKVQVTDTSASGAVTFSNEDTNVVKMYNSICAVGKDENGQPAKQVKIYDEGVGTGYDWRDRVWGGATGAGIDKNIKDVYQFFLLNYQPGDNLYLFGFSRGAYTARSLGGLIRNCGILKPEYIGLLSKAYELYRDRNAYTHPDSDLMRSFRAAYAYEDVTPIHFIGVWDTVGSLGFPVPWLRKANQQRYKFHDATLSKYVRHAYHALAVDERRSLFAPTLWQKSQTVKDDPNHEQHKNLEQRWFAGVHSNVGGGYPDCGLSNVTLDWMIRKAQGTGLCFNDPPLIRKTDFDKGAVMNSYTLMYRLWRPQWRTPDLTSDGNQTIDESVWERWNDESKNYRPKNLAALAPAR